MAPSLVTDAVSVDGVDDSCESSPPQLAKTRREINAVVAICRVGSIPQGFGHYTKHGAAIKFKVPRFYYMEFHQQLMYKRFIRLFFP